MLAYIPMKSKLATVAGRKYDPKFNFSIGTESSYQGTRPGGCCPLQFRGKRKRLAPLRRQAVVGGGDYRYPMNPFPSDAAGCVPHETFTVAGAGGAGGTPRGGAPSNT